MRRYEKRFSVLQRLTFSHTPPFTSLDPHPARQLKTLNPDEPRFFASPYYYWWAFLRLNDGYMDHCSNPISTEFANLYSDFGDVRSDDFVRWWIEVGALLFCDPPVADKIVVHHKTPDAVDHVRDLLISVPLTCEYEALVDQFRTLLKQKMERYRVVYARPVCAKYPIRSNPILATLQSDYQIAVAKREHPDHKLIELAEIVGLYRGISPRSDTVLDQANVDKVYKSLTRSAYLIEWVGRGIFPVTKKPTAKQLAEWGFNGTDQIE